MFQKTHLVGGRACTVRQRVWPRSLRWTSEAQGAKISQRGRNKGGLSTGTGKVAGNQRLKQLGPGASEPEGAHELEPSGQKGVPVMHAVPEGKDGMLIQ